MQSNVYAWSPVSPASGSSPASPAFPASPYCARSPLLSVVLLLTILRSVAVVTVLVLGAGYVAGLGRSGGSLSAAFANTAHNVLLFLALVTVVELLFLTGVWMQKKWGALGFVLLTVASALLALRSTGWFVLLAPVGWDSFLALIIVARWQSFE